jgi:hypothetical protein
MSDQGFIDQTAVAIYVQLSVNLRERQLTDPMAKLPSVEELRDAAEYAYTAATYLSLERKRKARE